MSVLGTTARRGSTLKMAETNVRLGVTARSTPPQKARRMRVVPEGGMCTEMSFIGTLEEDVDDDVDVDEVEVGVGGCTGTLMALCTSGYSAFQSSGVSGPGWASTTTEPRSNMSTPRPEKEKREGREGERG